MGNAAPPLPGINYGKFCTNGLFHISPVLSPSATVIILLEALFYGMNCGRGASFGKSWNDLGTTFSLLLQRVHALADLRGRGAKDAPPRGSKFCHFPQIIAFHIHLWSWCPHLGEILDPPLGWKQNSPCSKFSPRRARYHIIPICLLFTKP